MTPLIDTSQLRASIQWLPIGSPDDPMWSFRRVLYAICQPRTRRILYIGKADYRTVRERFNCRSKDALWNYLEDEWGISATTLRVGGILTRHRLTTELLSDIESLLIAGVQPAGNVQAIHSSISRPGLRVFCRGSWPHPVRIFVEA